MLKKKSWYNSLNDDFHSLKYSDVAVTLSAESFRKAFLDAY